MSRDRWLRSAVGALAALAFFFVEAGIAEIALARNAACIESALRMRLGVVPRLACLSEFPLVLVQTLSRGVFQWLAPEASGEFAWGVMGALYGLLGFTLAQLSTRWGWRLFLGLHIFLVLIGSVYGYLALYVVS